MVMTYARRGIRLVGTPIPIVVAANAGALAVFQVSNAALNIGTKTVILKRLLAWNNGAGNTVIHIGTGVAGAVVDADAGARRSLRHIECLQHIELRWLRGPPSPSREMYATASRIS